jgi:hypothetical protein
VSAFSLFEALADHFGGEVTPIGTLLHGERSGGRGLLGPLSLSNTSGRLA